MTRFRHLLGRRSARENGFTVLELMVVVLVLGVLTSISVPAYLDQQRLAIMATVQHDLRANVPVIYGAERAVFEDTELALQSTSITEGNEAGLVTTGEHAFSGSWCFQVWHEFSPTDIYYRHYNSLTSEFTEGECPPSGTIVTTPPDTDDPSEPSPSPSPEPTELPNEPEIPAQLPTPEPTPEPTPTEEPPTPPVLDEEEEPETPNEGEVVGEPAVFNEAYTDGPVTYTPRYQFNAYGPGSATIRVEITSTSPSLTEWHYVADLSKGPYFGFNPSNIAFHDGQGRMTIENGQMHVRAINQWNGVSTNRSIAITFSISNYYPPVMPEHYTVSVTPSSNSSQWYACVDVRVQGSNWFPVRWEHIVDLRSYFASLNGSSPMYTNLIATPVEGGGSPYFATLRGNSTNNNMVSATYSGHGAQQVCYYPQGKQPFV